MAKRFQSTPAIQRGLKPLLIGVLILLFLIPIDMIKAVRSDRRASMGSALEDVSSKAGGRTTISTPFLAIPVRYEVRETNAKGEVATRTRSQVYCIFPQNLALRCDARVSLRARGIYSVPVHQSDVTMDLDFAFNVRETGIAGARADWAAARIYYAYDDSRSLRESPALVAADGTRGPLRSGASPIALAARCVSAPARITVDEAGRLGRLSTRLSLSLSGAQSLYFLPLADTNTIRLLGDWASPSFSGFRLPVERTLGQTGFNASWFVDETARALPRVVNADAFNKDAVEGVDFGVEFIQPTDIYQEVHRALRYAVLFLFIPFAALFLFEVLAKHPVHVVQYILVGFANCVFYLLLLALAEHLPFRTAYILSASAVVAITTFYVSAFLSRKRLSLIVLGALSLQYAYLFCALSSEDYALLIGAIGLFCLVAFAMATTRKFDWYGRKQEDPDPGQTIVEIIPQSEMDQL